MQSSVTLSGLIAHFIAALCSRPTGRKVTLLDVGANSGAWTDSVLRRANRSTCARARNGLSAVMLEPQPLFSTQLAALAARWSADGVPLEHVPAAAWDSEGTLSFRTNKDSRAAHVDAGDLPDARIATKWRGDRANLTVRALDLANLLRSRLPVEPWGIAFLKLDVEAAEYSVLPHLLLSGALCRVSHLFVEWHLLRVPDEARLAALGLRLALEETLRRGCRARRRAGTRVLVYHDELQLNKHVAVPGLERRFRFHHGKAAAASVITQAAA